RKVPSGRGKALTGAEWRRHHARGLQVLQAPGLARFEWLVHGFSTRPGGASELNGTQALNLGFTDWDSREHVDENRTKFLRAIGPSKMRRVTLRQIHSDIPHRVDALNAATLGDEALQGDALFTREPGILLAVQTADCIPILLADRKQRVIAAIHS